MKFFIKRNYKQPKLNRVRRTFLFFPELFGRVNDMEEFHWMEWKYFQEKRYIGSIRPTNWEFYKRLSKKEYFEIKEILKD